MPLPRVAGIKAGAPSREELRVSAQTIHHPLLKPVSFGAKGEAFSPEQAAIFAVVVNPSLRAARDARGLARAQIIQAGILPNPQVNASLDLAQGNTVPGVKDAYGLSASWEITALFARSAKIAAAKEHEASVDLSVAWQEWQDAEAAKLAVYKAVSLARQAVLARQMEITMERQVDLLRKAVAGHEKTDLELEPAIAAADQAKSDRLLIEQQEAEARIALNQAMGLAPSARIAVRASMPGGNIRALAKIDATNVDADLENRRLDLIALRLGYKSQEAALRAAVRAQFPKLVLGIARSSDNAHLKSLGPSASLDIPVFDRNQGNIAIETATRQQLYDDYIGRIADARAEIAKAFSELRYTLGRLEAAEETIPALEKVSQSYEQALGGGQVDATVAYGARQALNVKRLEVEKLKSEAATALIGLELATGTTLDVSRN